MVSWAEHEREHKIEAMHERNARLAAYREVLEMVEKRAERNRSRAAAMKAQFPGSELYGETEQTYLAFLREDSVLSSNIDALIKAEAAK